MPYIVDLQIKHIEFLKKHDLEKKWFKIKNLLENNLRHPSLNFEKIIIKSTAVYSFRLDEKYRGVCFFKENNTIEVIAFTNHYR